MGILNILIVACFIPLCSLALEDVVCDEMKLRRDLYAKKPKYYYDLMVRSNKPTTPRTIVKALRSCTVFRGQLVIKAVERDRKFDENVRIQDLDNLKNLEVVEGIVVLILKHFPEVKDLSFLSRLKKVKSTDRRLGFSLYFSHFEMLDLRNIDLQVLNVNILANKKLCYLERFSTLNPSIHFFIRHNKPYSNCSDEGKVCSQACDPSKGCSGPSSLHCFACRWMAGNDCIQRCESREGYFTPSVGNKCGKCHADCRYGCFGPKSRHCHDVRQLREYCPEQMFYNTESKQCEKCAKECFREISDNPSQRFFRLCSGPGNWSGPGGCNRTYSDKIKELRNEVAVLKQRITSEENRKIVHLKNAIKKHCVADGRWSKWSEWSKCNAKCGDGISTRGRSCLQPFIGGSPCQGNKSEEKGCNNKCPVRNLVIVFYPSQFKVKPHKVQRDYSHGRKLTFVDATILGDSPSFLEVKELLYSVFIDAGQIRLIWQAFGFSMDGKKATFGTSIDGSVTNDINKLNYCDAEGKRYRWSELKRRTGDVYRENDGKRLLITHGGCRTLLEIY